MLRGQLFILNYFGVGNFISKQKELRKRMELELHDILELFPKENKWPVHGLFEKRASIV